MRDVKIGEDVDIVNDEGRALQKRSCMAHSPAGLAEKVPLVGDVDRQAGNRVRVEIFDDLVREMMDIDGDVADSGRLEFSDDVPEQGPASHIHKGFRKGVGDGLEPCAQTGCKNQCLHLYRILSIPSSLWHSVTLMSNLSERCLARCSAQ